MRPKFDGDEDLGSADRRYDVVYAWGADTRETTTMRGGAVLPITSTLGVKVDPENPTYPWHDIIGDIRPKAVGLGAPARAVFRGGTIGQFAFVLNDLVDFEFHIPHDYAPGTDLYWHIHWAHNGTDISGTLEVTNYLSYAKGHDQAAFSAEIAPTLTYATVDVATTPQYRHRIDEIQITASSPTATQINSALIEPDGILLVTSKVTGLPSITGGSLSPVVRGLALSEPGGWDEEQGAQLLHAMMAEDKKGAAA